MERRVREFDWAATPLGPMDRWPQSLKTAVNICVTTRFPAMLWWGEELTQIYNDGYALMLGQRHPHALGRSGKEVWYDVWHDIKPLIDQVFLRGESTWSERGHLLTERNGVAEDAWFTWSYSPLYNEEGKITGLMNIAVENTKEVLAERDRDRYLQQREAEQRRVKSVLESITDAFFALDRNWKFSYANRQAERVLNRAPGELLGLDLWAEYPGLLGTPFESIYRRAMNEGIDGAVTSFYPEHQRWYEVHCYPSSEGVSVYFRNVTQRIEIEAALRKSEEQRRLALDSAGLGAWHLDVHSKTLQTDARFRRIFGLADDRASYEDAFALIHPADAGRVRQEVEKAMSQNKTTPYEVEHRVIHADGSVHWVLASGRTNVDASGILASMDGTLADITSRKQLEEDRQKLLISEQKARREAEEAGRMKDEFLATLSHELRTPLSAILGWSQILRRNLDIVGTVREGLSTIERNARAQAQIIDDLLDMSRIISGKVSLDMHTIDLGGVVRAALDTIRPAALAKGIELHFAESDEISSAIYGDGNRLQQVFWNLLSNAVKFTPAGGTIVVRLARLDPHWCVTVTDSGEGIAPAFLDFVFDRFRQADASTTRRHGGLGLGLAIVKQLIELHGGAVEARSDGVGRGSTFVVRLPTLNSTPDGNGQGGFSHVLVAATHNTTSDTPENFAIVAGDHLRGRRILVVDDEPDARTMLVQILGECGASVIAASNAHDALSLISRERPDLLISDIGMPVQDGYELIRTLRSLPADEGGATPAIALTAYVRAVDQAAALQAGFQHHAAKPVEPAELMTKIASLLSRTRQRSAD